MLARLIVRRFGGTPNWRCFGAPAVTSLPLHPRTVQYLSPACRFVTTSKGGVPISSVATYVYQQTRGNYDDIFDRLSELASDAGYCNDGSLTQLTKEDAVQFIKNIGACPEEFGAFVAEDMQNTFSHPAFQGLFSSADVFAGDASHECSYESSHFPITVYPQASLTLAAPKHMMLAGPKNIMKYRKFNS